MLSLSMMLLLLSAEMETEATIEAATDLQEQANANHFSPVVKIPVDFPSSANDSLPAHESAEYVEIDVLLESSQIANLPHLLNALQRWQAEGKVSEEEGE